MVNDFTVNSDNIQLGLLERLHGTMNEEVQWNLYDSLADTCHLLAAYRECYNRIRPRWFFQLVGGGLLVSADVYLDRLVATIPNRHEWAASRKKLVEMTGEPRDSDVNDNADISSEISMEIQIKWINPCLEK